MPQRSKEHHYVPQTIQRQFIAAETPSNDKRHKNTEVIYFSKRDNDGKYLPPKLRSISNTFVKRNFYTITEDKQPSDIVEKDFYGNLDNYFGKQIPIFMSALDNGSSPELDAAAATLLRNNVVEMMKRTPDFSGNINDVQTGTEIAYNALANLPNDPKNEERIEVIAALKNEETLKQYGRDARVFATIDRSAIITSTMQNFSIRWVVSKTKYSFILGSRIAYQIGGGLRNKSAEIWMPISPKHAIVLVREDNLSTPLVSEIEMHGIRKANNYIANSCNAIASHSQKLIDAVTRQRR